MDLSQRYLLLSPASINSSLSTAERGEPLRLAEGAQSRVFTPLFTSDSRPLPVPLGLGSTKKVRRCDVRKCAR